VWIAATSTVLWIDIEEGQVFEGKLDNGAIRQTRQYDFEGRVGAAVPGEGGSLLVATQDRLVVVTPDGERIPGPEIVPSGKNSRTNDGACDPRGRFLIGTAALDDGAGEEHLSRLEFDGTVTVIDDDLSLSNGLAWSPDGTLLYSVDTLSGTVWVRSYEAATGAIGPRTEHLRITDGLPDGICVDNRGYLWVALWGAGRVQSFTPTGEPDDVVRVPTPHPSSVAFIGNELDTLLITTASRDLSSAELLQHPDAGRLFIADVLAVGLPTHSWSPSGTRPIAN
jgi:sugar lactone lactonase YvrE